jgi:glycosyltransferase involved in cell wall biosynthesis
MKKVAIIYHYIALYRLPIFQELMKANPDVEYTLFSGTSSEINIKKIDTSLSSLPLENGGLRWSFLKNKWFLGRKFLWQKGLMKAAAREDFDAYIFLGSPYFISTWLAVMITRLRGKKIYYWMHGVYKDNITAVDKVKLFGFYKLAHGFFLYGNRSADILKKYNVKPAKDIHVIYNSLDYEKSLKIRKPFHAEAITSFRAKYFKNTTIPVIIFIGRLNLVKRIDMLIEAQSILKNRFGRDFFNLLIIGDGDQRPSLESQAHNHGLADAVAFLGARYDEAENGYLLSSADLCVTPGEVGLTAIHSLSYGTPVISHDNLNVQMPEVEAIKSGLTGELYAYNSIESLVEVISDWFNQHPSKDEKVIQQCYQVVDKHFNPHYQSKILNTVLKNV